ncbi:MULTISPECIES: bifunctional aconitate hydratase 2/2-methylisocitrate dehydratase [Photorhabdus]|uniref:bifunctional aconitate hydratase 2/2-methylisocitrate dehydratase n=1 Tax=Photorhabdus TaxID=29487 RepID=UPI000DCB012C|nr:MULTISPECIES: bifunctional aconitate hydratase 2/2-methylisocitrate dehydratase [Photorhabdus]MCT8344290.1 bifunctional aconitate hydratase 2/2-methylisocitrate dehydratase [Photorhabdus kleinii]RAX01499.1 bifunctional aconitate hydratase 2/2-methylisocitrate dehydratase [Photorhabdus sp. S9-53]RAX02056.1 bifunctional aconitate hydratase 2/2-methylisocitrate dehydratase [Photorhabdus sp. S10-54]RAX05190.1 bifunctional aconitate hydratase 2/2-methylisocitrate dehydratase [Photorhabdus sp. S8-
MLEEYRKHVAERAAQGVVPKPLDATQAAALVELLKSPPKGEEDFLLDLLINRIPPGVDEAAYVKAGFLAAIAKDETISPLIAPEKAVELLGTMQGGYNIHPLIDALDNEKLAPIAAKALSHTLLMFDNFYDVEEKARAGNPQAKQIMQSWADAQWYLERPELAEKITVTVFKVTGETNTDDLSPAQDAWSRPDIPLHALAMLKNAREGIVPDQAGVIGPIKQIEELNKKGYPLAYVGDVVGTGSSRKSATNSVLWFMGDDIPFVPNKRGGGVVLGGKIAPIFFNTMEDAGALPIELDVNKLNMGEVIDIYPYKGEVRHHETNELLAEFELKTDVLLDEVRAGGRIPLIIGRGLTSKARESLGLPPSDVFRQAKAVEESSRGFSLAQKMVGRACGTVGIRPGEYCEPKMTSVGSQDTTGPMTRDELKDLACLGFSADLVMQSFCHTAAYPKPVDVTTHHTLPDFIMNRGGVSLRPGDGIIHSWLNRMLLPDTVGTGGDSHTRFPIGISFPAGSGLVAFAAATGVMPLDMPESVLVRFKGQMQPGITLRDLVHAIPYYAIQQGLLTVEKKGKKNIFSGRILEIEGLPDLKVEQAFELADASAERSAAGCTIKLDKAPIIEYLQSNIVLLKWMIAEGYGDRRTLERRVTGMENWLKDPQLLEADADAEYAAVIEIDLAEIKEPILCAPNDPDDARLLSDVANSKIDEVFIGSCMTNIGHFRAAGKLLDQHKGQLPTRLWVAPPTKMDAAQLTEEGYYSIFGKSGARVEIPGCSLCMGNQARVADGVTVVSTSTRNFPNRLGTGANVYLASAELAAVASLLGRLPTPEEYQQFMAKVDETAEDTYRYLNFDQLNQYTEKADDVIFQTAV